MTRAPGFFFFFFFFFFFLLLCLPCSCRSVVSRPPFQIAGGETVVAIGPIHSQLDADLKSSEPRLHSQDSTARPSTSTEDDGWQFVIAPYAWLLSVNGDVKVRGQRASFDQSFSDIFKKIDLVLEARLEAKKGPWGFTLDPTFGILSDEADVGPIEIDVETRLRLIALTVQRDIYEGPLGSSGHLRVEAGVGGILVSADTELDFPAPTPDPDFDQTWVDPVVGIRGTFAFGDKYKMRVGGLVGGFGIGEASDLSLGFEGLLGRKIGENTTLWIGYRLLHIDYDRGSGAKRFELDATIHGPTIGVGFQF